MSRKVTVDITGRVVFNQRFGVERGNSLETQVTLPVSSGTYLLRATGGLNTTHRLVVIE